MKQKFSFLFLIFIQLISAQNYYYYKNQKQYLTLDKKVITIYTDNSFSVNSISTNELKTVVAKTLIKQ